MCLGHVQHAGDTLAPPGPAVTKKGTSKVAGAFLQPINDTAVGIEIGPRSEPDDVEGVRTEKFADARISTLLRAPERLEPVRIGAGDRLRGG